MIEKLAKESPAPNGMKHTQVSMQHFSYHIHVDAVGVRPGVLEVLLQPLPQWVGNLVKADELFDP